MSLINRLKRNELNKKQADSIKLLYIQGINLTRDQSEDNFLLNIICVNGTAIDKITGKQINNLEQEVLTYINKKILPQYRTSKQSIEVLLEGICDSLHGKIDYSVIGKYTRLLLPEPVVAPEEPVVVVEPEPVVLAGEE